MRLVRHRAGTSTARSAGRTSASLRGDPTTEAIRRLRYLCAGLTIAPMIMITIVIAVAPPGSPQHDARGMTIALVSTAIALSIAVYALLGRESIRADVRLNVGFVYQIVIALIVAVERHVVPWPPGAGFRDVSPVSIVVLLFAALVPNHPRRTLVVSLLAAAMEPTGLAIAVLRGLPAPPMVQALALCFPPFFAAGVATLVSRVVHGLAQGATEARRLGSYGLVERLGEGGMGEVWKAEHDLLARPAAIKLIRPETLGDAGALRRFEREAQATARLESPHTIRLFDFGVADDGTFYYVMELLDGRDLESVVRSHGPMPAARAVHVLRQVCESLDEAHARGLVHRDIKPANVYLCRYARRADFVKVLDFGLVKERVQAAQAEGDGHAPTMSVAGSIAGTPAFLAPEMAVGDAGDVDARADVYAVGCLAYWLLTGKLVFEGDSALKMIVDHARTPPVPPSKRTGVAVPEALEALVLECLEKEPALRPRDARALGERLAAIDAGVWSQEEAEKWWADRAGSIASEATLAATEVATPRSDVA